MARILIIDDSPFARRVLRQMLEPSGHAVLESTGGLNAMEQYFMHQPDAVFLDLIMEEMSGFDVLRRLKEFDRKARVVIATADVQGSTEEEAMRHGACAVITKPLESAAVLRALQTALE